jgi:5-hydroxyisourate hydrolase
VSAITTHILDTSTGRPASGVPVVLERQGQDGRWERLGSGETDSDGRLKTLVPSDAWLEPGVYRLLFDTAQYFRARNEPAFYPAVIIVFETTAGERHYHVPLLLSPFGYSTYRGS